MRDRIEKVNIKPGTSVYNLFQSTNASIEKPFKEFIDNSTQSFFENREKLLEAGTKFLQIKINLDDDKIIISDNAFGMNSDDFDRMLTLGGKKEDYGEDSRGEFGIGLKQASLYLGNIVQIESTELGSNELYKAVLDSAELNKNIETIDKTISYARSNEHYTKITITKLTHKPQKSTIHQLITKLGVIYGGDIYKRNVSIIINDNYSVQKVEPKLLKDGYEVVMEPFDGKFIFDNKEYIYYGWIGMLDTGTTSFAGFSLLQHDRAIIINYRPEALLGKRNSFPQQRIVGEITVNDFPVVYNKTDFQWAGGLETKFIEELKKNKIVKRMIDFSIKFRKGKNQDITEKKVDEIKTDASAYFSSLKSKESISMPVESRKMEEISAYVDSIPEDKKPLKITFEGVEYTFSTHFTQDAPNWLRIEKNGIDPNEYTLIINYNYKLFSDVPNSKRPGFVFRLGVLFAVSQLSSMKYGLKDAYKFTNKLNEVLNILEKKD